MFIPQGKINAIFKRFPEGTSAHLPLMLGYKCGLRLGEVFALTWDCVDFLNRTIRIEKQVQWDSARQLWYFSSPKYNSYRTIDIDTELSDLLRRTKERQERAALLYEDSYIRYFRDDSNRIVPAESSTALDLVMVRDDGSYVQPRIMQHASAIIHHQMGFDEFTFHSLRHTHATMLLEANISQKYIQDRLGHKKVAVTIQTYQHLTEKMKDNNKVILETIF